MNQHRLGRIGRKALHWGTLLGAIACADVEPTQATALTRQGVVYGGDDRVELHEALEDDVAATAGAAVLALIPHRFLQPQADGTLVVVARSASERHGLCPDEPYASQVAAANCSGTLIAEDLVLTAGHCVWAPSVCESYSFVFDYAYRANGQLAPIVPEAVYRCSRLVFTDTVHGGDAPIDLAVVQLDRAVPGRLQIRVARRAPVELGSEVFAIGTPEGVPLKVDSGGTVRSFVGMPPNGFKTNLDAFEGSSGSGVFSREGSLLGVLGRGQSDFDSVDGCRRSRKLDDSRGDETVFWAELALSRVCAQGGLASSLCLEPEQHGAIQEPAEEMASWHETGSAVRIHSGDSDGCSVKQRYGRGSFARGVFFLALALYWMRRSVSPGR